MTLKFSTASVNRLLSLFQLKYHHYDKSHTFSLYNNLLYLTVNHSCAENSGNNDRQFWKGEIFLNVSRVSLRRTRQVLTHRVGLIRRSLVTISLYSTKPLPQKVSTIQVKVSAASLESMFSGNETVSIETGSFLHKQTINLNERKCQPTPPKLPLAFPFFPALRITFYRLTNEITDEINQ